MEWEDKVADDEVVVDSSSILAVEDILVASHSKCVSA